VRPQRLVASVPLEHETSVLRRTSLAFVSLTLSIGAVASLAVNPQAGLLALAMVLGWTQLAGL
jgi:hypothetical protein